MVYQSSFHHGDKIPEKNGLKGEKRLFGLTVSEVSINVHSVLLPLYCGCG